MNAADTICTGFDISSCRRGITCRSDRHENIQEFLGLAKVLYKVMVEEIDEKSITAALPRRTRA